MTDRRSQHSGGGLGVRETRLFPTSSTPWTVCPVLGTDDTEMG